MWDTPSESSAGSLPLGNGDLAANVWVEPSGDLRFYLAKSDAWDGFCRLIKIGRVRVTLTPPLLAPHTKFTQQLNLADASTEIRAGTGEDHVTLRVWIDAHRARIVIQIDSATPRTVRATLEPWRTQARTLTGSEEHAAYGAEGGPQPIVAQPDLLSDDDPSAIIWYQRNETSIWASTLDHQSQGEFKTKSRDPLLHRTFGGGLWGEAFRKHDARTLETSSPTKTAQLFVDVLTRQTTTAQAWISALQDRMRESRGVALADAWRDHADFWRGFWSRSHVEITSRAPDWDGATRVTAAYNRHRYLTACCGRGAYPIKFNGGLFTADWGAVDGVPSFDADYRRWGGAYWFQNTRLAYWPMLASGDTDMIAPLARMYREMLPLAENRTRRWFGHDGAFFPETAYFWGTFLNGNYGWKRDGLPPGEVVNRYIGRDYNGGLELLTLLLAVHAHTDDATLLANDILTIARPLLTFFREHYSRTGTGQLRIAPAQALETWWECVNPTPDVAGLHHVLHELLALPENAVPANDRAAWQEMAAILPPLPLGKSDGETYIRVAEQHEQVPNNMENAELYAVFPFPLYGIGRPDIATARWTFAKRRFPDTGGWRQDAVHAARLGLTENATYFVLKNATQPSPARFRGFFGPNYDWLPDFDHGGVTQLAIQSMLVQSVGEKIHLFPAWPAERWNVSFQLHLPQQTVVNAELKEGKLVRLEVTPDSRRRDVIVMLDRG